MLFSASMFCESYYGFEIRTSLKHVSLLSTGNIKTKLQSSSCYILSFFGYSSDSFITVLKYIIIILIVFLIRPQLPNWLTFYLQILVDQQYILYLTFWKGYYTLQGVCFVLSQYNTMILYSYNNLEKSKKSRTNFTQYIFAFEFMINQSL